MGTIVYLVTKYQDTAGFQGFMKFLFNPDSGFAPPQFWKKYRSLIFWGIVVALLLYYRSTLANYTRIAKLYTATRQNSGKPSVPPLTATYIWRQGQNVLAAWLMDMFRQKALILHNRKGSNPWSISKGPKTPEKKMDSDLVDEMFTDETIVTLYAPLGEPNPPLKNAHLSLVNHLKQQHSDLFYTKNGPFLLYLLFVTILAEIPFHIAELPYKASPATTVIAFFSAFAIALPFYAVSHEFLSFFTGSWVRGSLMVFGAGIMSVVALIILLSIPKLEIAVIILPAFILSMAAIVHNAPLPPKNRMLFKQILGYQKYLRQSGRPVKDQDLSWTIGLDVHTDIDNSLTYANQKMPEWLETDEKVSEVIIRRQHQTFGQYVNEALYGKMKSRGNLSRGRDMGRF